DFGIRNDDGSQREIPSYEAFDLRAGLMGDRWSLELFVKNVADELGRTSMFGNVGTFPNDAIASGVIRPRTIGLSLSTRF
ncbi:MAG: TonB-dependent receptor, partial [Steroidobacteraceae bacterium]